MKKFKLFCAAACLTFGFAACNNDDGESTTSTTTTDSSSTTDVNMTTTSTGSYAAQADSFKINSEAGNYLDAKTGKKIRIKVDPSTGARVNEETNEPVRYYVDSRNWWVYGDQSWESVGEAKMQGTELRYKGDGDKWVTYDEKWKVDGGDGEMKTKDGDSKTKVEKDGDTKTKMSDGTKIKTDEDGTKVKTAD